ncbi:thermonuclease family protein [Edaphobacillus lindanitolerans]|uniref:Micrococcal nuclease n=1 Tax=Edaphobacillus lindanitolerans TaxID=550447 RepID=A0A1U7PKP0_9BACI|nr:thermonuclease family protein [Edaphobacillus lindanitolerans]SIT85637.1 micrococcal nuclease [Edaphobacillus lindanitolerans]
MSSRKTRQKKRGSLVTLIVILLIAIVYLMGDRDEGAEQDRDQAVQDRPDGQIEEQAEEQAGGQVPASAQSGDLIPIKLVKTIDGDTIKIRYEGKEQNVRYLLIDTPETNHPRLGKQPFGEQAKERNRELLANGEVSIEFDIGPRTDKYGRLLAYVYVDGESVEEKLLEEGLARVAYVYPPNTRHLDRFEKAEKRAKDKGIGIWSIEDYATDRGFDNEKAGDLQEGSGEPPESGGTDKRFNNCTELRKVYPEGVKKGHPAYESKMDRDNDGVACEPA